jgi:hypothetical protein
VIEIGKRERGWDLPEQQREIFYRHMGHSAQMSKDVYQCPLAVAELTQVDSFLNRLDEQGKGAVAKKAATSLLLPPPEPAGNRETESSDNEETSAPPEPAGNGETVV